MSNVESYDGEKKHDDQYTTQVGSAAEGTVTYGEEAEVHAGLKRQLKSRHMAMISIGGVIGTGLFLGTGSALARGGPLGLFLGYAVMGSICYSVMICLGEMIAFLPIPGGHITLASRFVDPALSFTLGWNYWYNWVIILPAELSASAVLINFWNKSINNGVWIAICMIVVIVINLFGAGAYGEAEFWFSSIKVLTIVGLIILGIIISAGGGPNGETIGFKYWGAPTGPFVQYRGIAGSLGQFLGFFSVLTQAAFSYIGTEIVAIAAGEAKNPRRNLPRSIKKVYIRILIFYLGGTFIIGMIVESSNPSLTLNSGTLASPFVIAIQKAGIPALPSIINACLLTSAWSAASSDLYTSSRAIYGLSLTRNAPKIFSRTTRKGLPYVAIAFCAAFGLLAFMSLQSTAGTVFGYFSNLTASAGLLTWWGIAFLYTRFYAGLKAQGIDRSTLPYTAYLNRGCFAARYALVMISVILFFQGFNLFLAGNWSTSDFITAYFPCWFFPVLWVGYKYIKKTKFVRASEMDFVSDLDQVEADSYDEPPPRNWVERVWGWIM